MAQALKLQQKDLPVRRKRSSISLAERIVFRSVIGPAMNSPVRHPAFWVRRLSFERSRIIRLWKSLAQHERYCERRPIRRIWGLESISCDWSAAMVMEHLYLVGKDVEAVLQALNAERNTAPEISIARVKPVRNESAAYDRFIQDLDKLILRTGQSFPERNKQRWPHPWFGPLNAVGWLRFYYVHLYLHRRQLEHIASAP